MFLLFALGGTNVVTTAPEVGQPVDLAADPAKILFISLWYELQSHLTQRLLILR
jgi:aquaporin related protein